LKLGGETVMFRHEKRFVSPTGIAVLVSDKMSEGEIDSRLKKFNELKYERVGLKLQADLVAVKGESGDPAKFEALVKKVKERLDGKGVVLMSENPDVLAAGPRPLPTGSRCFTPPPRPTRTPWPSWPRKFRRPWWSRGRIWMKRWN